MTKALPFAGVAVLATVSCHGSAARSAPTSSPSAATVACALADAQPELATWRQVRGDGFTFCIPADWQRLGDE